MKFKKGLIPFLQYLSTNKTLEELDIEFNSIGDQGISGIFLNILFKLYSFSIKNTFHLKIFITFLFLFFGGKIPSLEMLINFY